MLVSSPADHVKSLWAGHAAVPELSGRRTGGGSGLLENAGKLQREARNGGLGHASALLVHLVRSLHGADRRGEHRPARVAVGFAGGEDGLLADDSRPLDFLDVAVAIGDDPVAAP